MIRRIVDNKFLLEFPTISVDTRIKEVKLKNGKIIRLKFKDTPGEEKFNALTIPHIEDADCLILGFDVTDKKTLFYIKDIWYPTSKNLSSVKLKYLIGNKIDLERKVDKEKAMKFAKEYNLRYFETSCKTGEGVEDFYNDLINEISKI